ncbi:MAG: hypothetical protein ACLUEV_11265 [Alistipes sp.]
MEAPMLYAFLLTLGAGLATGIGSGRFSRIRRTGNRFHSLKRIGPGDVFVEILHGAQSLPGTGRARKHGGLCARFFGGMLLSA